MREIDVDQNSDEWVRARLGIPTASGMAKIFTSKTQKLSTQQDGYLAQLIAEWWTGQPLESFSSDDTERGHALEEEAFKYYRFAARQPDARRGKFCLRDDGLVGCSPDVMVGEDGLAQIKCLNTKNHMAIVLSDEMDGKYMTQMQCEMYVTGRAWNDFIAYHPDGLPNPIIRIYRNEDFIANLEKAINGFIEVMLEKRAEMIQKHGTPPSQLLTSAAA
jgi:hypothetical protein